MTTPTGQKARMLAGELYLASDPELVAAHLRAQALLARFNATAADAGEERRALLAHLFAKFGEENLAATVTRRGGARPVDPGALSGRAVGPPDPQRQREPCPV